MPSVLHLLMIYLSVCFSILSICKKKSACLSAYLSCQSVYYLSVYLFIYPSICDLYACLFIYSSVCVRSVCLSFVYLSYLSVWAICLSVCFSILSIYKSYLSVCLAVLSICMTYLSACLSILSICISYLSVCLFICPVYAFLSSAFSFSPNWPQSYLFANTAQQA